MDFCALIEENLVLLDRPPHTPQVHVEVADGSLVQGGRTRVQPAVVIEPPGIAVKSIGAGAGGKLDCARRLKLRRSVVGNHLHFVDHFQGGNNLAT